MNMVGRYAKLKNGGIVFIVYGNGSYTCLSNAVPNGMYSISQRDCDFFDRKLMAFKKLNTYNGYCKDNYTNLFRCGEYVLDNLVEYYINGNTQYQEYKNAIATINKIGVKSQTFMMLKKL